jgi:WD40 repeat protein
VTYRTAQLLGGDNEFATQGGLASGVAFSPDGSFVAAANSNGGISLVDVAGWRKLGEPLDTELPVATFSPDSNLLAAPTLDRSGDAARRRRRE